MANIDCNTFDIVEFQQKSKALLPRPTFSILNVNCQSLRNKFNTFELFLNSLLICFDVICVTETWLYDDELQYIKLDNYNFTGTQRDSRGGGAGVFVRCGLAVESVAAEIGGAEVHSVRLTAGGPSRLKNLVISVIYRQPGTDINRFLQDFENILSTSTNPHIIAGDINIDTLDSHVSEAYINLLSIYNFTNTINLPTHYSKAHRKWSCLDHIIVNISCLKFFSGVIRADLSDHFPTFSILDSSGHKNARKSLIDLKCINYFKLNTMLESFDWSKILDHDNTDTLYNEFLSNFQKFVEKCSYIRKTKQNKYTTYFKPWITNELKSKLLRKNLLYRQTLNSPLNTKLKQKYITLRNEVTTLLRHAKADYFTKAFKSCHNTSDIWKIVNQEILDKPRLETKIPDMLRSYCDNSIVLEEHLEIANEFNNYFSKIGKDLASKLPTVQRPNMRNYTTNIPNTKSFALQNVTKTDVLNIIESISGKKSSGLDGISGKLLKVTAEKICSPLTDIINSSIDTGIVPLKMKSARVTPIFKKGDKKDCRNYRPISILPIFSKILEKIINNQILNYLEEFNLLNSNQFGFRRQRGTADAVSVFINKTLEAFNEGKCTLGIFIDFSKAFDTIDHEILLLKLKALNFNQLCINWIKSYLTNRTQITKIGNVASLPSQVSCGVPQGSILGPTLFLIYINDLCNSLKLLKPILYADDTSLFIESKNLNSLVDEINADLNNFHNWCLINKMTVNFEKTNYILLKNPQNHYLFRENSLILNQHVLKPTTEVKFLGLLIDPHLNWSAHISKILQDLRPVSRLFYNLSQFLPKNILITLYYSLVNSKFSYCIDSWGNAPITYLNKLTIYQKKLIRIINRKPFDYHTANLFITDKILKIDKLHQHKILIKAHNTFYSISRPLSNHCYSTRHSQTNLPVPLFSSHAGQRTIRYRESFLWNNLTNELKNISNPNNFKTLLKDYLLLS